MSHRTGASKPRENDNLRHRKCWEKLKDAVTGCVLRCTNRLCVCGRGRAPLRTPLGDLTALSAHQTPTCTSAPAYLIDELCQVADVEARQRLRSSSSSSLIVSRTRLSTVGGRAFPVAAARVWNGLPELVTSAPSVFRSRLKTQLFNISYPSPL